MPARPGARDHDAMIMIMAPWQWPRHLPRPGLRVTDRDTQAQAGRRRGTGTLPAGHVVLMAYPTRIMSVLP
jgi:hypothetical protein